MLAALLGVSGWLASCSNSTVSPPESAHAREEVLRGAHGGRLLKDGAFALELAIVEAGVRPEFRAWSMQEGAPIAPEGVRLTVELERFGGAVDRIAFAPQEDFLRSTSEVREPHSFVVTVEARVDSSSHRWTYESLEGRTQISAAAAEEAGVVIEVAGTRMINDVLPLHGVIAANPESVRAVSARYPGLVKTVVRSLGDTVKRGEILATVESNESLQTYAVTAPIGGVITHRLANPGEAAGEAPLFVVTDLQTVTADLAVFSRDLVRVRAGQRARVRSLDGAIEAEGRVIHIGTAGVGANQALIARVKLDNAERRWTPGVYVSAELLVGGKQVPVAVKADAVQRFRDRQVVFQNDGETYQVQPIEPGRSDGEWVEVVSGLPAGAAYVARNSFLIKADIEKSGAGHD